MITINLEALATLLVCAFALGCLVTGNAIRAGLNSRRKRQQGKSHESHQVHNH